MRTLALPKVLFSAAQAQIVQTTSYVARRAHTLKVFALEIMEYPKSPCALIARLPRVLPAMGLLAALLILVTAAQAQTLPGCAPTGAEKVLADKAHYAAGDTVQLSGSGHAPFCPVTVRLKRPNSGFDAGTSLITGANGSFTLSYTLGFEPGQYGVGVYLGQDADPWTSVTFTSGGYIETDRKDYGPVNPVTITGGGWLPFETVSIVFHEIDGPDPDRTYTAVADAGGSFASSDFSTGANDFNVHYRVTATGQASGFNARTTFADSFTFDNFRAGNWVSNLATRTGTITTSAASTAVTGVSTAFGTQLHAGDPIYTSANVLIGYVKAVGNATNLTLLANALSTNAGIAFKSNFDIWTSARTGTITTSLASTAVTGTSTQFTTEVAVGDRIAASTDAFLGIVSSITDNTHLTLTANAVSTVTNNAYKLHRDLASTDDVRILSSVGSVTLDASATINALAVTADAGTAVSLSIGSNTLNAASLGINGGGNGTSTATVTVGTGGAVIVTGDIGLAATSGTATLDLSSGSGTASAGGNLNMSAASPTGGRRNLVNIGTGSVTVTGNVAFTGTAANDQLTFSAAGTAYIGGNLGAGGTLTNFATAPGSTIDFNGSGNSSIAAYTYQNLMVNKTGAGTATLAGSTTISGTPTALTVTSGTFAASGSLTLTLGGGVSNSGTIQLDGGAAGCGSGDTLLIRSTVALTQRSWSGGGAFNLTDVDVKDQAGSALITVFSGTNSLNNGTNWTILSGCVKLSQTITFAAITDKTYGDPDVALGATASSGLTVSYVASGNCTIVAGPAAHITGAGSCTITAQQAGNGTYNAAPDVSQSFAIAKADQTIGAISAPASATYNTTVAPVSATATSGLAVSFAGSGACNAALLMTSGTGTCTITGSQAGDANYNAAPPVTKDVTAAKANQTIGAISAPASATYNTTVAPVSATATSGLAVSFAGSGACNAALLMTSGTGTCTITGSQAGDTNYNAAPPVTKDVAADKASSTTVVTGGTFTYDTFAHSASVSVTGAGGLSLTPAPVYSGGCLAAPVNVSQTTPTACTASYTYAGDANHTGSTGSATITINKAPTVTTVTATNYVYDGSPHGETASVIGPGLLAALPVIYTGTLYLGSVPYGPTTTTPPNPGDYSAAASYGGGPNYLPSAGSSNFTIAKATDTNGDGIPNFIACSTLFESRVVYNPTSSVGIMLAAVLPASRLHTSLQAAVIAAADNDVITMYADTTENVIIGSTTGSGGKDLRIVGCGHKITGALLTKPVITAEVSAGANDGKTGGGEADIHIDDVSVLKGSIGFLIQTSKGSASNTSTLLKSIRSDSNTGGGLGIGIKIEGNGNEVRGANSVGSNTPGDGIRVIGNSNVLKSNRVMSNKGDGIDVTGNSNTIASNKVGEKGTGNQGNGIVVSGASNTVDENDVFASTLLGIKVTGNFNLVYKNGVGEKDKGNKGGGILITGDNNLLGKDLSQNDVFANTGIGIALAGDNNMIRKNDIGDDGKGNTGDGLRVAGSGNVIHENNVFANGGDGIDVSGGTSAKPNVLLKNDVGDRGKGNLGNGILVAGLGNGIPDPVELEQNTVKSNKLDGIKITGSGHELLKNESGGRGAYPAGEQNGGCAYNVVAGNFNATGNKANDSSIAGADRSAFPTGCTNR